MMGAIAGRADLSGLNEIMIERTGLGGLPRPTSWDPNYAITHLSARTGALHS